MIERLWFGLRDNWNSAPYSGTREKILPIPNNSDFSDFGDFGAIGESAILAV
jgi:hypothetical protein